MKSIVLSMCVVLLLAQVVVATPAPNNEVRCHTIGFSAFENGSAAPAGFKVGDEFGVSISANNNNGPDEAIVFDSSAPTGGDEDLGTPNEDFGGPGVGIGGESGMAGENNAGLGNLLIIAEDVTDGNGDGLVDDPDDDLNGGTITFVFDSPVDVISSKAVDIEETTVTFTALDSGDAEITSVSGLSLGDNSVQTVSIGALGTKTLEVEFEGSGAVDDILVCYPGNDVPEFSTLGALAALGFLGVFIARKRKA